MNTNTPSTHEQRDQNFGATLIGMTTERTAIRQGVSPVAASVAGIAIAGLVAAGVTIGPSIVNAAVQLAAKVW